MAVGYLFPMRSVNNADSVFSGNIAYEMGSLDTTQTVLEATIAMSDAKYGLGGNAYASGHMTINNLQSNDGKGRLGGGIYFDGDGNMATSLSINRGVFLRNMAATGGGVYGAGSDTHKFSLFIVDCLIKGNVAIQEGGGGIQIKPAQFV